MIYPLCAKYGFKNNSHDFLEWDGDDKPPRELLGLTDKPAGHMIPKEQWWPAVSCRQVGEWWAIWSIIPDQEAPRAGMVKSKVFLWPINEISKVNNLDKYISILVGDEQKPLLKTEQYFIDDLLNELTANDKNLIIDSVRLVPHIINILWKNLWDEAKVNFSVRVSFTPPQAFNSAKHPTFYCVPSSLTNQWFNQNVKIIAPQVGTELSRAARYLNDNNDVTLSELIKVCGQRSGNIKLLGRLARAADNIDICRRDNDADSIISALRSIISCAGMPSEALAIKSELLLALKVHFEKNSISVDQVLSLGNLSEDNILEEKLPKKELLNWISHYLPSVIPDKLTSIFERCSPKKSRDWWWESVEGGIKRLFDTTNADDKLINWLSMGAFSSLAAKFIYVSKDADNRIFTLAKAKQPSSSELKKLESIAINQCFPQVYSLVIHQLYSEISVISKQIGSMNGWEKGLPYLVEHLAGSTLLEAIELEELAFIIPQVSERCKEDTGIIKKLDIDKKGAFTLWCLQLENNGIFYPSLADKNSFNIKLYNNLTSELTNNLLDRIVTEMAEYLLTLSDRTDLWARFDITQRKKIADIFTGVLASSSNTSFKLVMKEVELIQSIKNHFNSNSNLSPQLLISCLSVPISTNEHEVLRWVFKVNSFDWSIYINKLGEITQLHQWRHLAKELYKESYGFLGNKAYLKPAVDHCASLLGTWERTRVSIKGGGLTTQNKECVINRVSALAAELAHDRLEYIWQKAGGRLGDLHSKGSFSEQWYRAVQAAEAGALVGGVKDLLDQLLEEYPNNLALKELETLI
jgi:hypothetical protein